MPIKSRYLISKDTNALIQAKVLDYDTIALEKNDTLHIQQTPTQIMKESCIAHWSTYEDRRQAVSHHLNYYQKIPIPVSLLKHICLFPTHSPTHIDNHWIAYQNIEYVDHVTDSQTTFTFLDGQTLNINVSKHTIQTQIKRTYNVINQLSMMKNMAHIHTKMSFPHKRCPIRPSHIDHFTR